jgi:hypothetical protein
MKITLRKDAEWTSENDTDGFIKRGRNWWMVTHGELLWSGNFLETWDFHIVSKIGPVLPEGIELYKVMRRVYEND